jgi:zinc protease
MRFTRFIFSSTLIVAAAFSAVGQEASQARATVTLSTPNAPSAAIAPIAYKQRTLQNGLQVYSVQDRTAPTVAIQVWYRVGSKDDPEHRSGFAHLFEHMLFKSTKNMPSEMMDRLTEDVGGENNATTLDDATVYYEIVPSNYLQTLLWAEAERMASLNVDDPNFKSERDVVKEEFRSRILSPPYGRLFYAMTQQSFSKHPYKRPGIGSIEDLDAATLADVKQFHDTFYRPDNAVLIVAGDFDQQQLDAWVDTYFTPIAKPSSAIPRVTVKEPVRTAVKRVTERAPNVPLPAFATTWQAPASWHEDAAALNVLSSILGEGQSSRLYQSLVYNKQIASEVNVAADLREDLGLFVVLTVMASGHMPAEGEKEVNRQLALLQSGSVTSAELEKAKNLIITASLRERETNNGKAFALGDAVVMRRDANAVNSYLSKIQAVTASDVQRVARKYLLTGKPVTVTYLAEAADAAQKPAAGSSK